MTFNTSLGKQKIMRINNPRPGLSAQQIQMSGSMFISSNPFDATVGNLTSLIRGEIIRDITETLI
jgi:hypothetical protein